MTLIVEIGLGQLNPLMCEVSLMLVENIVPIALKKACVWTIEFAPPLPQWCY